MLISSEQCDQYSDQEIIKMALREVDYFSCLYTRYEARLLRYIIRLSSLSKQEAEDILQEAFIKIWKNLHAYDPSLKFNSWIYRIVHNCTISHWRRMKTQGVSVSLDSINHLIDLLEEKPGEDQQPGLDTLSDTLQKIPQKYQEVLVLKYLEEMSYDEISDVLKIPEGTVATRINRAKQAIAKLRGSSINKKN